MLKISFCTQILEYLDTIDDLINMTKIGIEDMLQSWDFSTFVAKSFSATNKDVENDWYGFMHPSLGWCYTFDPAQMKKSSNVIDFTKMPVSIRSTVMSENGKTKAPIYLNLKFNVNIYFTY